MQNLSLRYIFKNKKVCTFLYTQEVHKQQWFFFQDRSSNSQVFFGVSKLRNRGKSTQKVRLCIATFSNVCIGVQKRSNQTRFIPVLVACFKNMTYIKSSRIPVKGKYFLKLIKSSLKNCDLKLYKCFLTLCTTDKFTGIRCSASWEIALKEQS